jgi:NAD(P)-dependent dehydrogenase (short-subunit alcohol dehydrogenase family)
MARLDGKVCIVTGGTSGIGRRTAEVFAAEGARVVIAGRRESEGRAVAEALGDACDFVRTDVTEEAQIGALIDFTVGKHGRVDCLFNNAGGPAPTGGIEGIPADGFDAAIATLLRSVLLGMKHVAPVMVNQRSGSIINNGSVAGLRAGLSSSHVYSAAKAAVIHLTRCVAMELGEQGVRVNSISPGAIATGIFGKAAGLPPEQAERTAEIAKAALASAQPIPRAGLPDDVAHAAVFLASDDSSFVNGHDFVVDGGLTGGQRWSEQQARLQGLRTAFLAQAKSGN